MTASTIGGDETRAAGYRTPRAVVTWLVVVALMVVAMIVVGGATRLTDSGLSITEWKPVTGVVPPLSVEAWEEEFAKYQQIPEFQQQNFDMDLAGFKTIYWWEWAHRLLGRAIGFVVLVPMVFFWAAGRLSPQLKIQSLILLAAGGMQGAIGWWMVASGLTERTDVSQYRLAVHLTIAFLILAYLVWIIRGLRGAQLRLEGPPRAWGIVLLIATVIQIFLGGLVAGLDAGYTFNTWPLMDGRIVPSAAFNLSPWWINHFEDIATVQFQHRMAAYLLLALALWHWLGARGGPYAAGAGLLFGSVVVQAAIGVVTLLLVVPLWAGLLHQVGAAAVLVAAVAHLRAMYPLAGAEPVRGTSASG